MMRNKTLVIGICALILLVVFSSGCIDFGGEKEEESEEGEGTPETTTYSGTWSGTWDGYPVSGTCELTVDFDNGTVSGSISGDAVSTLSGSATESGITASGTVNDYPVTWTGTFSADQSSISGDWSDDVPDQDIGSGTWSAATV